MFYASNYHNISPPYWNLQIHCLTFPFHANGSKVLFGFTTAGKTLESFLKLWIVQLELSKCSLSSNFVFEVSLQFLEMPTEKVHLPSIKSKVKRKEALAPSSPNKDKRKYSHVTCKSL